MALTSEDLIAMKAMQQGHDNMSPYESYKVSECCSRRASGTAITGLVLASAALLIAIAAWVFAGLFTGARTRGVEMTVAKTGEQISALTTLLASERSERLAATPNITQTVDLVTRFAQGQSSTSNAQSTLDAILAAINNGGSTNPLASAIDNSNCGILRVSNWKSAEPCGCGCNG